MRISRLTLFSRVYCWLYHRCNLSWGLPTEETPTICLHRRGGGGCTTQSSGCEGSSKQRRGIQAHFCHPAHVQGHSHFHRGAVGSGIITNLSVHTYHPGVLGIFFKYVTLEQLSKVVGKSFFLKKRLFGVTLVGIYNYYGTWIIWALPYKDDCLSRAVCGKGREIPAVLTGVGTPRQKSKAAEARPSFHL